MQKEIYRTAINQKIEKVEIDSDNSVEFFLEDKTTLKIEGEHRQDCCENVYADFDVIDYHKKDIEGKNFKELLIFGVEKMGFLLCLYQDWEKSEKIFVPCYNSQNGYYSSELRLVINGKTEIDISEYVEDDVY